MGKHKEVVPFKSIDFDSVLGTPADRWRVWIEGVAPLFLSNVYAFPTEKAAIKFTETNCFRTTVVFDFQGNIVLESDGKPFRQVVEERDGRRQGYSVYLIDREDEDGTDV